MPAYSQQDVSNAFDLMLQRRNAVIERLQITDPADPDVPLGSRPLPAGASEMEIAELEAHFGKTFPPSYKIWLSMHNGAPWANLGTHFFSILQIIDFDRSEKSKFFARNLARFKRDSAEDLIVFAASPDRNITVAFISGAVDEFGEWQVICLSKRDKVLYTEPDFVKFLEYDTFVLQTLLNFYS